MKIRNNDISNLPFRKKLALNIYAKYRKSLAESHELTYLFWECTLRCNLNCIHCGSDCTKETVSPDMPLNDFLDVLKSIRNRYDPGKVMVALTGGEPLMRSDLAECGKAISELGFPWGMVTNGYMLNEMKFKQLLDSGLRSVTVSLDGLEESHDWFRGVSGSFARAENAVRLIASVPDFVYDVATCIHKNNIHQIEELYQKLQDAGVKYWRIFTIFPKGRAAGNPVLKPDGELLRKIFDFISDKRKENKMKISYGCEGYLGSYEGEVRDSFFFCRAGINIGSVLIDGSVSACPSLRSDFIQGNIYKDNFLDIWDNQFSVMRDRSWTKTGVCADCNSYKYCEGNGLHLRNETDGKLLFCHLNELCA